MRWLIEFCLVVALVSFSSSAYAIAPDGAVCLSRALPAPDRTTLKAEALGGYGFDYHSAPTEVRDASGWAMSRAFNEMQPQDTLCVLGENSDPSDLLHNWPVHGGTLMILGGIASGMPVTLDDPFSHDEHGYSGRFRRSLANRFARNYEVRCWEDPWDPESRREYDRCMRRAFDRGEDDAEDILRTHVTRINRNVVQVHYKRWQAPSRGTVVHWPYGDTPEQALADAVGFVSLHEMMYTPSYGFAEAAVDHTSFGSVDGSYALWASSQTFSQMLALMIEGAGRHAALGVAADVMDALRLEPAEVAAVRAPSPGLSEPIAVHGPRAPKTGFAAAAVHAICWPDLEQRFLKDVTLLWDSLYALRESLCGAPLEGGPHVLSVPAALDRRVSEVTEALRFTQTAEMTARLEAAIGELASITVDQSVLLNELLRLATEEVWDRRLAELDERIGMAQATAQDPSFFEVVGATIDLGGGAAALGKGLADFKKLLSGYSGAPDGKLIGNYLYENREGLSKASDSVKKGHKTITGALEVFDEAARRSAAQEARILRAQRAQMQEAFDALIAQLRQDTTAYQNQRDALASRVAELRLEAQLSRHRVADSAGSILFLVAQAHVGQAGANQALQRCGSYLARHQATTFGQDYAGLVNNCLLIGERVEAAQTCRAAQPLSPEITVVQAGSYALRLANRDATACFAAQ